MASNIVLADALSTPADHTFVPHGPDKDGAFWFIDPIGDAGTNSTGAAIGAWRISVLLKSPAAPAAGSNSGTRTYRAVVGLHEPVISSSSFGANGLEPAPTVAYTPRCFAEFVLPERNNLQNRKDLRKMMANLLANAQVVSCVENLIPPY
jgi:hypothetical protein